MPSKSSRRAQAQVSRPHGAVRSSALAVAAHIARPLARPCISSSSASSYDADLARALEASRHMSDEELQLKRVLALSEATASQESQDATDLMLAIEASLRSSTEDNSVALAVAAASAESSSAAAASAEPSAVGAVTVRHTLKVSVGQDTCRLRVEWTESSSPAEVLAAIHAAVLHGAASLLESREGELVLRYRDDEGDLCILVEAALEDFLAVSGESGVQGGVLRLFVDTPSKVSQLLRDEVAQFPLDARAGPQGFSIADDEDGEQQESCFDDEYDAAWSLVEAPAVQKDRNLQKDEQEHGGAWFPLEESEAEGYWARQALGETSS